MTPARATGEPGRAASAARPGARRVFFALWPDDTARNALAALAGVLNRECGGRIMRGPNIHLTLVFLGDVAADRLSTVAQIAASAAVSQFEFTIDTLHYWRHNRIAWAGTCEIPGALAALVALLAEPLRAAGFRLDRRPYVPHVTLVRDARRAPPERMMDPIAWRAADFVLVESVRRENRVDYEVLRRWPLAS